MNKLFYIDPSIKIDSFLSMFNYAIYHAKHNGVSREFLDNLFEHFISNIKDKNLDPFKLANELHDAYFIIKNQYPNDLDVITVTNGLSARCHEYLEKQMWLKMKQDNLF